MVRFEDIKFDCRLFNGYKPCVHGNECAGCPYYEPQGQAPAALYAGVKPVAYPGKVSSILIIKTGAMGDVLRTTALLHGIRRRFPDAQVTWITAPESTPLLSSNRFIHELLPFCPETCSKIENRHFDVLFNFEKEKEPLLLAGKVQATARVGFAPTVWNTPAVFNAESAHALTLGVCDELKFRLNKKSYPQIIAEMAGFDFQRDRYVLELSADSLRRQAQVESGLESLGLKDRPRVGLNTGCGSVFRTKQWTLDGWCELIEFLQQRTQSAILLMGGKAEAELNQAIKSRCPGVFDTGMDNSLHEFFGVVDCCNVMVTSDTLGMHIGIALNKYVVAIFGSTSHHEIDLFDQGEKVVTDFACSPCYKKTCELDPMCMTALRGHVVGEVVLRGLAKMQDSVAAQV